MKMILKFVLLFGLIGLTLASPQYNLGNVFGTAKNVTGGIIKKLPKYIPSPDDVFMTSKDIIAGYPFEVLFSAINKVCSSVNSVDAISPKITPDIDKMALRLITKCQNYSFPILEADKMWQSPHFNVSQKVVIIISGWTSDINESPMIYEISKGYLCRGGYNVVGLDTDKFIQTLYTWSALNVEEIGKILAKGIVELRKLVPLENIHLIGHSLGANIAGYVGKYFQQETDEILPHITGLDPARPCFNEGEKLTGLNRGDAEFVDVIHSNCGVLGKRDPIGDVDYYPGGLGPLQRGCLDIICSHQRAYLYYAESIYPDYEDNYMATRCSSLSAVKRDLCIGKPQRMGYGISKKLKGNFFSDTKSEFPFGPTQPDNLSDVSKCGLCENPTKNIESSTTEAPVKTKV